MCPLVARATRVSGIRSSNPSHQCTWRPTAPVARSPAAGAARRCSRGWPAGRARDGSPRVQQTGARQADDAAHDGGDRGATGILWCMGAQKNPYVLVGSRGFGAGHETRTRNPHFTRVVRYQLRQAGMRREPQVSILNDFNATTGTTELRCAWRSRHIRFGRTEPTTRRESASESGSTWNRSHREPAARRWRIPWGLPGNRYTACR